MDPQGPHEPLVQLDSSSIHELRMWIGGLFAAIGAAVGALWRFISVRFDRAEKAASEAEARAQHATDAHMESLREEVERARLDADKAADAASAQTEALTRAATAMEQSAKASGDMSDALHRLSDDLRDDRRGSRR